MLANWMLYCVAVGALLSGGAAALEKALRPLGRGTRWVWAGTLLLTLAVPAAVRFGAAPRLAPPLPAIDAAAFAPGGEPAVALSRTPRPWWRDALDPARLEAPLAVGWGLSSAAVALGLGAMAFALRRRRRGWTASVVDGVPVLVSADTGPAVVGLVRSRIVLPAWALAADDHARRLVLEHEQEHVRAGDPRLLAAALTAAALMPWNPAVWWQLRRLRLAVEVDCDARVLRRRADVHAYGSVLLEMGRRAHRTRLAAAAAFAEPVSTLERRIRIMTAPRVRRPALRALGFGAVAAALAAAACKAPAPLQPSPGGTRQSYTASRTDGLPRSPLTPRRLLEEYYPSVLRDGMAEGDVIVFVLSADGAVVEHSLLSPPPSADRAAAPAQGAGVGQALNRYTQQLASMNVVKSKPGELGPTEVRIAIAQLKPTPADGGQLDASDLRPSVRERSADGSAAASADAARPSSDLRASVRAEGGSGADAAVRRSADDAVSEAERVAFRAAVARHYPQALRSQGVTGRVTLRFVVGADGKAHDAEVVRGDARFADAARAVAADLTYRAPGETVMVIDFAPERTPSADVR